MDRGPSSHLVGRAVLVAAADALAGGGISLMPLKGIWLQRFAYADAHERAITDVDVLVQEHDYAAARARLAACGWQLRSANVSESTYGSPGLPLPLDLHARLFTRGVFRMPTSGMFARGHSDEAVFGVRVVLPDPLDVLAHAIGHALKGGGAWAGDGHELVDIPRLAAAERLDPRRAAAHLEQLGLGRAARFVLPLTAANDPHGFASALLAALRVDPVGRVLTRTARALRTHMNGQARMASAVGFALDSSLPRAGYALALRVWDKRLE
jgi:hypothetical protein